MSVPVQIVAVYFIIGLVVLILFELITKRLSKHLPGAGTQAQIKMAEAGNPIGPKAGRVLMMALTWIFWPLVLIGAATDKKIIPIGGKDNGKSKEIAPGEGSGGTGAVDSGNGKGEKAGVQPGRPSDLEAS